MIAESVAATTAREQRYRVGTPNSTPRTAMLIGLDAASARLVERLVAARPDRRRSFDVGSEGLADAASMAQWAGALPDRTRALAEAIALVNIVVVVACAGFSADAAAIVAESCRTHGVRMTALVVNARGQTDAQVAMTLAHLRPSAAMVVVADDDAYVDDMLDALQA